MVGNLLNFPNENEYWAYLETLRRIREALKGPHYVRGDGLAKYIEVRVHGDIRINPWELTVLELQQLVPGVALLLEVYGITSELYTDRLLLILNGPQGIELYINDGIDGFMEAIRERDLGRAIKYDVFYPLKALGKTIRLGEWGCREAINRETEWRSMNQLKMVFRW